MIKNRFPYLKLLLIFSVLLVTITKVSGQEKDSEHSFYHYFLWYTGTIGEQPVAAKIAVSYGKYTIYYAYDNEKKWIELINSKVTNTTINAEVNSKKKGKKDAVELQINDLHNITGIWQSVTGEKKPIKLQVALKKLPKHIIESQANNELTPLLLKATRIADSISVYYSENEENNTDTQLSRETYSKSYVNTNNQIIYVDVNFDGYLDITISNAIYIYKPDKQRFEVENSLGDFYPGIQYLNAYDPYANTFQSSHWRSISWHKAIDGVITIYESEDYTEHNDSKDNIGVSENRIRYTYNEQNYRILEFYLNKASKISADQLVTKFIGDSKIGILENAQLILHYPSLRTRFYQYKNKKWKLLYTEFEGKKVAATVNGYDNNGLLIKTDIYGKNGKLNKEIVYKNESMIQKKEYHKNGNLIHRATFFDRTQGEDGFYNPGLLKSTEYYNQDGIKDGDWMTYYENGQVEKLERYKNGTISGDAIYNYENGQLKEIGRWSHGRKYAGLWKGYHENGTLRYRSTYSENEDRTGEWVSYYDDRQLETINNYVANKQTGVSKSYYANGQLNVQGEFIDDKKTGEWNYFSEDGILERTSTYFNGERNGAWKTYHDNKQLASVGNYLNNQQTGEWIIYTKNGKIRHNTSYKNGERSGKKIDYYDNGQIETSTHWKDGKKSGLYQTYYNNGQLSYEGNYLDGEEVGEWKGYYSNGQLQLFKKHLKGKITKTRDYNPIGQLTEKGSYLDGKLTGKKQFYHKNGAPYKKEKWIDGKLMKIISCFDENGNKLKKGTLAKGTGSVYEYDAKGKLINEKTYVDGESNL